METHFKQRRIAVAAGGEERVFSLLQNFDVLSTWPSYTNSARRRGLPVWHEFPRGKAQQGWMGPNLSRGKSEHDTRIHETEMG